MIAGRDDLGRLSLLGLLGLVILGLDGLGGGVGVEERLVVLLCLDEGILEGVGVWEVSVINHELFLGGRATHSQSWQSG